MIWLWVLLIIFIFIIPLVLYIYFHKKAKWTGTVLGRWLSPKSPTCDADLTPEICKSLMDTSGSYPANIQDSPFTQSTLLFALNNVARLRSYLASGNKSILNITGFEPPILISTQDDNKPFVAVWKSLDGTKVVLAFRGTVDAQDVKVDMQYEEIDVNINGTQCRVSKGMYNLYQELKPKIAATLAPILTPTNGVPSFFISGHSLGSALAYLASLDMDPGVSMTIATACPRFCNEGLAQLIQKNSNTLTLNNLADMIPSLSWSYMPNFQDPEDSYSFVTVRPIALCNVVGPAILDCHAIPTYFTAISQNQMILAFK